MNQCDCGHGHDEVNVPVEGQIHGGEECCGAHKGDIINHISTQLEQLVSEHDELTKRSEEYIQVLENIKTRITEIRGAADALSMLKSTLQHQDMSHAQPTYGPEGQPHVYPMYPGPMGPPPGYPFDGSAEEVPEHHPGYDAGIMHPGYVEGDNTQTENESRTD
jgi:hypothetical protein